MLIKTKSIVDELFLKFDQRNILYKHFYDDHVVVGFYVFFLNEAYELRMCDSWGGGDCESYDIYGREGLKLVDLPDSNVLGDRDVFYKFEFDKDQSWTSSQISDLILDQCATLLGAQVP